MLTPPCPGMLNRCDLHAIHSTVGLGARVRWIGRPLMKLCFCNLVQVLDWNERLQITNCFVDAKGLDGVMNEFRIRKFEDFESLCTILFWTYSRANGGILPALEIDAHGKLD